ncbi:MULTISPECIES: sugar transferase [Butyricimonas]|uniref:sugar transferase n=1 Tax=Butyricimonas TaxID=574697 RepID=UPI0007FB257C|nr:MULTISPECIES: sugar transferase [Butyricimonas]
MYNKFFKRLLDILVSLCVLPFVFLVILIVAPFIYIEDKGCVFYLAKRRGRHGRIFNMYKLRSMVVNAPDIRNEDNSTYNSPDDPRITKIGKFMRKTSVDELPQFINVLTGDMSIIGPRPVTIDRPLEKYDEKRRIRLKVRPGITGYSQAYFRNSISNEEKLEKDAIYAEHVTFSGDLKIFLATLRTVLFRKNIYNSFENER